MTPATSKDTNPKDAIGARKAKLSVIPAGVLFDLGLAMTEGMVKYGRHNYRYAGVRASVYYDAAMGHMMDWWEGQDIDPESSLSHVTKAIASLVVLRDAMFQGMLTDDRPPRSRVHKRDFNAQAASIIDQHAEKRPRHFTIGDTVHHIDDLVKLIDAQLADRRAQWAVQREKQASVLDERRKTPPKGAELSGTAYAVGQLPLF